MLMIHHSSRCFLQRLSAPPLDNRLQLPCIAERILDDLPTRCEHILFLPQQLLLGLREINASIFDRPASTPRKLHDAAFAIKKEETLRIRDRQ
jgi:hypothetical protein